MSARTAMGVDRHHLDALGRRKAQDDGGTPAKGADLDHPPGRLHAPGGLPEPARLVVAQPPLHAGDRSQGGAEIALSELDGHGTSAVT
jgi:hypothetical protein